MSAAVHAETRRSVCTPASRSSPECVLDSIQYRFFWFSSVASPNVRRSRRRCPPLERTERPVANGLPHDRSRYSRTDAGSVPPIGGTREPCLEVPVSATEAAACTLPFVPVDVGFVRERIRRLTNSTVNDNDGGLEQTIGNSDRADTCESSDGLLCRLARGMSPRTVSPRAGPGRKPSHPTRISNNGNGPIVARGQSNLTPIQPCRSNGVFTATAYRCLTRLRQELH